MLRQIINPLDVLEPDAWRSALADAVEQMARCRARGNSPRAMGLPEDAVWLACPDGGEFAAVIGQLVEHTMSAVCASADDARHAVENLLVQFAYRAWECTSQKQVPLAVLAEIVRTGRMRVAVVFPGITDLHSLPPLELMASSRKKLALLADAGKNAPPDRSALALIAGHFACARRSRAACARCASVRDRFVAVMEVLLHPAASALCCNGIGELVRLVVKAFRSEERGDRQLVRHYSAAARMLRDAKAPAAEEYVLVPASGAMTAAQAAVVAWSNAALGAGPSLAPDERLTAPWRFILVDTARASGDLCYFDQYPFVYREYLYGDNRDVCLRWLADRLFRDGASHLPLATNHTAAFVHRIAPYVLDVVGPERVRMVAAELLFPTKRKRISGLALRAVWRALLSNRELWEDRYRLACFVIECLRAVAPRGSVVATVLLWRAVRRVHAKACAARCGASAACQCAECRRFLAPATRAHAAPEAIKLPPRTTLRRFARDVLASAEGPYGRIPPFPEPESVMWQELQFSFRDGRGVYVDDSDETGSVCIDGRRRLLIPDEHVSVYSELCKLVLDDRVPAERRRAIIEGVRNVHAVEPHPPAQRAEPSLLDAWLWSNCDDVAQLAVPAAPTEAHCADFARWIDGTTVDRAGNPLFRSRGLLALCAAAEGASHAGHSPNAAAVLMDPVVPLPVASRGGDPVLSSDMAVCPQCPLYRDGRLTQRLRYPNEEVLPLAAAFVDAAPPLDAVDALLGDALAMRLPDLRRSSEDALRRNGAAISREMAAFGLVPGSPDSP